MHKIGVLVLALLTLGALASCSDDDGGGGAGAGGGDPEAFCERAQSSSLGEGRADPAALLSVYSDLLNEAPEEVRGDLETVRAALAGVVEDQDLEAFESDEVVEASENLEAYLQEECGVEPPSTEPPGTVELETLD
ncbi:MAG: hypothetical protein U5R31_01750 [Acidimicrobiia bacterium]|nr:hypothetical protein [Acidimicrobiia bacterium]